MYFSRYVQIFFQFVYKNHTGPQTLFASKNRKRFIKKVRLNMTRENQFNKTNYYIKIVFGLSCQR